MRRNEIKSVLEKFVFDLTGIKSIEEDDTINKKIGLIGDDAGYFLEQIQNTFGTDLSDLNPAIYFNEIDFFLFPMKKSKAEDITVAHVIDVIERGRWFEPKRTGN